MTTTNLEARAKQAAEMFLTRRGWEIKARDFESDAGRIDFVAVDEEGTTHFVEVEVEHGTMPPERVVTAKERRRLECIASAYIEQNGEMEDCALTFDIVALAVFGNDRAMVRLNRNVLSGATVA